MLGLASEADGEIGSGSGRRLARVVDENDRMVAAAGHLAPERRSVSPAAWPRISAEASADEDSKRSDGHQAPVRTDPDRYLIFLDALTQPDAGVKAVLDDVAEAVVAAELDLDVGVLDENRPELRSSREPASRTGRGRCRRIDPAQLDYDAAEQRPAASETLRLIGRATNDTDRQTRPAAARLPYRILAEAGVGWDRVEAERSTGPLPCWSAPPRRRRSRG